MFTPHYVNVTVPEAVKLTMTFCFNLHLKEFIEEKRFLNFVHTQVWSRYLLHSRSVSYPLLHRAAHRNWWKNLLFMFHRKKNYFKILAAPRFEPGTFQLLGQHLNHYSMELLTKIDGKNLVYIFLVLFKVVFNGTGKLH